MTVPLPERRNPLGRASSPPLPLTSPLRVRRTATATATDRRRGRGGVGSRWRRGKGWQQTGGEGAAPLTTEVREGVAVEFSLTLLRLWSTMAAALVRAKDQRWRPRGRGGTSLAGDGGRAWL